MSVDKLTAKEAREFYAKYTYVHADLPCHDGLDGELYISLDYDQHYQFFDGCWYYIGRWDDFQDKIVHIRTVKRDDLWCLNAYICEDLRECKEHKESEKARRLSSGR